MNIFKLPSGRLVDLDSIVDCGPVRVLATGAECPFTNHVRSVASNGDAKALYDAFDTYHAADYRDDGNEHGNVAGRYDDDAEALRAMIDDTLWRVRAALEMMNDGDMLVKSANALEAILNDYAPGGASDEPRPTAEEIEAQSGDAGEDMIATHREMKRRMAVTHSLYEQEAQS